MSGATGAPSPAPRSASLGPGAQMQMPSQPQVNGTSTSNMAQSTTTSSNTGSTMSQQNLNQIVIDYLNKKGYSRTEAMLRAESSNQDVSRASLVATTAKDPSLDLYEGFDAMGKYVDDALDVYKPELQRLLWPTFVHAFLDLIRKDFTASGSRFIDTFKKKFSTEHSEDIRSLEHISLRSHVDSNNVAQLYLNNKYRLSITKPAYSYIIQFLESAGAKAKRLIDIMTEHINFKFVDRAANERFTLAAILAKGSEDQELPEEDEGIPGHHPGSTYVGNESNLERVLKRMKLGRRPMDPDLESDVRADILQLDAKDPPPPGGQSLLDTHEEINIKQEPDEEAPTAAEVPLPPSTAADVIMEVQKIRENRDRFKIDSRTGGIGPAVSVCMFTFHNTFDSVTCLDFSGDNSLVAAGTSESYIRVWSLDGKAIPTPYAHNANNNSPLANSRRLVGHSGPVYAVSFAPSRSPPPDSSPPSTNGWLLSSSADSTIRLWSLDLFQQIVVYKAHHGPVWDLAWGPFSHYFVTAGHDKTARLWSTDHIRPLRLFAGHEEGVDVVAFHPNSAYVFTASADRTVRMWAVSNGQPVRMFTGHTASVTALACSPSGKILASADDAGWILLWDLAPGRVLKRMRGHVKGGIWSLSFSVESTVLVSGGADATVRVWDVAGPAKDPATSAKPGGVGVGVGDAGPKLDGAAGGAQPGTVVATTTAAAAAAAAGITATAAGAGGGKRRGKDAVVTADQISAFPTKKTPVYKVRFTGMNLVVAGGAYMP